MSVDRTLNDTFWLFRPSNLICRLNRMKHSCKPGHMRRPRKVQTLIEQSVGLWLQNYCSMLANLVNNTTRTHFCIVSGRLDVWQTKYLLPVILLLEGFLDGLLPPLCELFKLSPPPEVVVAVTSFDGDAVDFLAVWSPLELITAREAGGVVVSSRGCLRTTLWNNENGLIILKRLRIFIEDGKASSPHFFWKMIVWG